MPENSKTFEKSLSELEKIVAKLEGGEVSLEESIELFEKGMKNINDCRSALKKAEKKITELSLLESGNSLND